MTFSVTAAIVASTMKGSKSLLYFSGISPNGPRVPSTAGMCECSGTQIDSMPASSAIRASVVSGAEVSV